MVLLQTVSIACVGTTHDGGAVTTVSTLCVGTTHDGGAVTTVSTVCVGTTHSMPTRPETNTDMMQIQACKH